MKKKVVILVLALVVLAMAVPAYAAITDDQQKALNDLYQQMAELRKQMIQKYVDFGLITAEQGKLMQEQIDLATKYRLENSANGFYGPGFCGAFGGGFGGCGGRGFRGGFGFGRGPAFWATPNTQSNLVY